MQCDTQEGLDFSITYHLTTNALRIITKTLPAFKSLCLQGTATEQEIEFNHVAGVLPRSFSALNVSAAIHIKILPAPIPFRFGQAETLRYV